LTDEENRSEDAAGAEEPAADTPDEPQDQPAADEPAAEEPAADEPAAEEAPADEPAADEPAADEPAAADEPVVAEEPKAKDQAPGADLEPIALEPERELSAEERAALEAEQEERAAAEAAAESADELIQRDTTVELSGETRIQATGKRKTAVARVLVTSGSGEFSVNRKTIDEYFPRSLHRTVARQPLVAAGYEDQVDVQVRVHGGGVSGQADAVRHGIARALTQIDPELRGELKRRGMLTRDARAKERRKAGLKKARKKPQFSKR
jgi:small subunit ribosomal protein S9